MERGAKGELPEVRGQKSEARKSIERRAKSREHPQITQIGAD